MLDFGSLIFGDDNSKLTSYSYVPYVSLSADRQVCGKLKTKLINY